MKNAIWYKDSWLMPNSQAYFLYELYKKYGTKEDKKKLDDHVKQVDRNYKQLCG